MTTRHRTSPASTGGSFAPGSTGTGPEVAQSRGYGTDAYQRQSTAARRASALSAEGFTVTVVGTPAERQQYMDETRARLGGFDHPDVAADAGDTQFEMTENYKLAGIPRPPHNRRPYVLVNADEHVLDLIGGRRREQTEPDEPTMKPGKVSLAHGGVLVIPEADQLSAHAMDALRQPRTEGVVRIARAHETAEFPAKSGMILGASRCEKCGKHPCECAGAFGRMNRNRLSAVVISSHMNVDLAEPDDSPDVDANVEAVAYRTNLQRAERQRGYSAARMPAKVTRGREFPESQRAIESTMTSHERHMTVQVAQGLQDMDGHSTNKPLQDAYVAEAVRMRMVRQPAGR